MRKKLHGILYHGYTSSMGFPRYELDYWGFPAQNTFTWKRVLIGFCFEIETSRIDN